MICSYLKDWTAQQVFDKVVTHLLTQKERATENPTVLGAGCKYRLERDNKKLMCAAGCLIPDTEYSNSLECHSWPNLISTGNASPDHNDLIKDCQVIHDTYLVETWEDMLKAVAKRLSLQFNWTGE